MFVCFVWQLFFVCLRLQCCEVLPFLAAVVIGQISECSGFSAEQGPIANLGALYTFQHYFAMQICGLYRLFHFFHFPLIDEPSIPFYGSASRKSDAKQRKVEAKSSKWFHGSGPTV